MMAEQCLNNMIKDIIKITARKLADEYGFDYEEAIVLLSNKFKIELNSNHNSNNRMAMSTEQLQENYGANQDNTNEQSQQRVDDLSYHAYEVLIEFMNTRVMPIIIKEKDHTKNDCIEYMKQPEKSNYRPINRKMERITAGELGIFLDIKKINYNYYGGEYGGDCSYEILIKGKWIILHVDNKGVIISNSKSVKRLEKDLQKKNIKTDGLSKEEIHKLCIENNIPTTKSEYSEMMGDDKDRNFHLKSAQWESGVYCGTVAKKPVKFNGKLSSNLDKPHLTFILKHVYSDDEGITKVVLYSIPHSHCQKQYYDDIQYEYKEKNVSVKDLETRLTEQGISHNKNQKRDVLCLLCKTHNIATKITNKKLRTPKSIDEFRFNMNDKHGKPYTFINKDTPRYTVFPL